MNAPLRFLALAAAMAAGSALLSACGGGDDAAPDPLAVPVGADATVPDAALQSTDAYTRFTARVIAEVGASASAAPLMLPAASAPLSETAQPLAVD
jgi:hypothetical protein